MDLLARSRLWLHERTHRHFTLTKEGLCLVYLCSPRLSRKGPHVSVAIHGSNTLHDCGRPSLVDMKILVEDCLTTDGVELWLAFIGHVCKETPRASTP